MIKLGIAGVCGRMGRRIFELAGKDKDFEITLALEKKGTPFIGRDLQGIKVSSNADGIFLVDLFIDFTTPQATVENIEYVCRYKKPAVIGTTGLTKEQLLKIEEASRIAPVVYSPNMSIGVNILFSLISEMAKRLGRDYSLEIVEAHHSKKVDAPSGTAKKFAQILTEATEKKIPVHSIRLGDIVGDHTIIFCGNSERIEIKHQAHSRDLFAAGALKAAKWIMGKPAGLYSIKDVLA
ncbi:MAG: 4-hydroxy-tetrahydrodipicolinate reductase [Candidatus Omnitrophica bacterium]|nr:4-hydroxy-tetrahydrodipicolinate reductase [Candidatus Omnitrophota bacterium]